MFIFHQKHIFLPISIVKYETMLCYEKTQHTELGSRKVSTYVGGMQAESKTLHEHEDKHYIQQML